MDQQGRRIEPQAAIRCGSRQPQRRWSSRACAAALPWSSWRKGVAKRYPHPPTGDRHNRAAVELALMPIGTGRRAAQQKRKTAHFGRVTALQDREMQKPSPPRFTGRSLTPASIRANASRRASEAIDALVQVASDPSADAAARVAAAQTIISTASSIPGATK